jgi:hypothetical protein
VVKADIMAFLNDFHGCYSFEKNDFIMIELPHEQHRIR